MKPSSKPTATARSTGGQPPLQAVLFDMDGVVTDTARAHALAWQRLFDEFLQARAARSGEPLRPFDIRHDYRQYVDGKPRYAGVQSFLASRAIELPYGQPDDRLEAATVCGLGNRKNLYFRRWLEATPVQAYPGTLALIAALRRAGIRTAVFSASRNAQAVLKSAGVLALFDACVDGSDLEKLGLPGKPDPAMLIQAATKLAVPPERCAVVEDAIAGIKAGARGGFGLLIGVDHDERDDQGAALKQAGAALVVHDLSELALSGQQQLHVKTLANLPSALTCEDQIRQCLAGRQPMVFLDYDGTLTPIVADHTQAFLAPDMRAAVQRLSHRCPVAIVSGRDLARLKSLVQLDSVFYAGSHGFEISGPAATDERLERGVEFLPELDQVEQALRTQLTGIAGHALERKRFSIAVHFRQVAEHDLGRLDAVLERVLAEHPRLQRGHGKKVYEIQPDIDWNKGQAVLWLLQRLGLDQPNRVPLYVGDDITDEDAFRVLAGRGLCIAVRDHGTRQSAADYALQNVKEVQRFLNELSARL